MLKPNEISEALAQHYHRTPWGGDGRGTLSRLYCHAVEQDFIPQYTEKLISDAMAIWCNSFRGNLTVLPAGQYQQILLVGPEGAVAYIVRAESFCWPLIRQAFDQTVSIMEMLGLSIDTAERWDFDQNVLDIVVSPDRIEIREHWFRDAAGRFPVVYHDGAVWVKRN